MWRTLALILLVVGVSLSVMAGPITGYVEASARFDKTDLIVFDTVVDLDYTIASFTFGATAIFDLDAFDNLFFTAAGALGTLELRSMLDFEPQTPAFVAWTNAGKITLGGATLFGVFVLRTRSMIAQDLGAGAALGIYGTVEDVTVTAATYFNMFDMTSLYHYYGYDWMVSLDAIEWCGEWYKAIEYVYGVIAADCELDWSGASIYVDFPFTCLCVTASLRISCDGFGAAGFDFSGIETGIPWLSISPLHIDFSVRMKHVSIFWELVVDDFLCVTPYFSLEGKQWDSFWSIEGITLNALMLEYSYNGVTVRAGEIFDDTWYTWYMSSGLSWGFTLSGGLVSQGMDPYASDDCIYDPDYDEFFGIWIDGDSCCGGAYDIGVISFFDTTQTSAFFDWAETVASFEVGIGTNASIGLSMSLKAGGLQWFQLRGTFRFREEEEISPALRSRPEGVCGPPIPGAGAL